MNGYRDPQLQLAEHYLDFFILPCQAWFYYRHLHPLRLVVDEDDLKWVKN